MSENSVVCLIRAAMRETDSQEAVALYKLALKLATEIRGYNDPLVKIIRTELNKIIPDQLNQ
jgi:hypothetical protein